jgi:hypothetical protein
MKKLTFFVLALLIFSGQVQARYCTTNNWNKGRNLYKKYEGKYNEQVSEFNKMLETYNNFGFFSKQYSVEEFSKVWGNKQSVLIQAIDLQKDMAFAEVSKFDRVKDEIIKHKKGLVKSKDLWSKLAEYCYDEDEYENYKIGRNNMRKSINTIKLANGLVDRINRLRLKYLEEVGFINQSKDFYLENCSCSE